MTRPKNPFTFDKANGAMPRTAWLESGNKDEGWTHIKERHLTSKQIDEQATTSYFPNGQTIKGRTLDGPMETNKEVQNLIRKAVRKGEPSQGNRRDEAKYTFQSNPDTTGVGELTVRVNNAGEITTAYPESGPKVNVWIEPMQSWKDNI